QVSQDRPQMSVAGKDAVYNYLVGLAGQDSAQLTTTPMVLTVEIAFGSEGGLRTTRQTTQIDVEDLKAVSIVVPEGSRVADEDLVQCQLQLSDIGSSTVIQSI